MTSNKPSTTSPSFAEGDEVELCGLAKAPHLNRRIGTIVGAKLHSGRHPVILLKESKQMAIKPENLKAIDLPMYTSCFCCEKTFNGLTACGNCQMVFYCSKECQRCHWNQKHKEECASLKQGRKARHDETKLPTDPAERFLLRQWRAARWLEKGKYVRAEAEWKAIMQEPLFEDDIIFRIFLAQSMLLQRTFEKNEEAITVLQKAVKLPGAPKVADSLRDAYQMLGNLLYVHTKDLEGAEKALKKALELDGGNTSSSPEIRRTLQEVQMEMVQKGMAQASVSK